VVRIPRRVVNVARDLRPYLVRAPILAREVLAEERALVGEEQLRVVAAAALTRAHLRARLAELATKDLCPRRTLKALGGFEKVALPPVGEEQVYNLCTFTRADSTVRALRVRGGL
jgi:hypothetical protein